MSSVATSVSSVEEILVQNASTNEPVNLAVGQVKYLATCPTGLSSSKIEMFVALLCMLWHGGEAVGLCVIGGESCLWLSTGSVYVVETRDSCCVCTSSVRRVCMCYVLQTGFLAMETLLSLTSKKAGDWFKEELRTLGGLDHIVNTGNHSLLTPHSHNDTLWEA